MTDNRPAAVSDGAPRVVVGVDGSECSRLALAAAGYEAKLRDAVLDVVGVWSFPSYVDPMGGTYPLTGQVDATRRREEELLQSQIENVFGTDPKQEMRVLTPCGSTAKELLAIAEGADLLVVGSRGRGGFLSAVLGSTAMHCINHSPCPVMIVRVVGAKH